VQERQNLAEIGVRGVFAGAFDGGVGAFQELFARSFVQRFAAVVARKVTRWRLGRDWGLLRWGRGHGAVRRGLDSDVGRDAWRWRGRWLASEGERAQQNRRDDSHGGDSATTYGVNVHRQLSSSGPSTARLLDPKLDVVFKLLFVANCTARARRKWGRPRRQRKTLTELCSAFGIELTGARLTALDDPDTDKDAIVTTLIRERRWP
jgi:hypothetical protein